MTKINYKFDGKTHELSVKGHAEYSKDGEPDIVCTAVSILCSTLATKINSLYEKRLIEGPVITFKSADVYLKVSSDSDIIKNCFDFVLLGFEMISENYPNHVKLNK